MSFTSVVVRRNYLQQATKSLSLMSFQPSSSAFSVRLLSCARRFSSGGAGSGRSPLPPSPRVMAAAAQATAERAAAKSKTASAATATSVSGWGQNKSPVSWTALFVTAVVGATAVGYFNIERERRLERAMGKVVSSESSSGSAVGEWGWTPSPNFAPRKFIPTRFGWFPEKDAFGAAGKPAIGGPWSLVDMEGNLVTNKSFEGKWMLLYFGFARCPDICPSEMMKVGRVMDALKKDHPKLYEKVVPVFVTVDPARDSIQALKAYAADFHPSYIFLTGSPVQVQRMAKMYRVYVSKADESVDGEDYLVDHSIVTYFHDDTGDLADCFSQSMRHTDILTKVVDLMSNPVKTV